MKAEINIIFPENLDGYRPTKKRFNLTFDTAYHAQAEQMAKDLGVDLITLCRAIVAAGIASYQYDPTPYRAEAARAKARAAEAAELRARDARREAERLASPDVDVADGYAVADPDHIPEI